MAEVVTKVKSVAYPNDDGSYFKEIIYPERLPVILKSVNIGTACSTWTPNYLANALGDIPVKVHVCAVSELDFLKKNFLYKTMKFNNFMNRVTVESHQDYFICPEEKYYLRSLGVDARKDVADIRKQFPGLCEDIIFPPLFDTESFFSSVFRISSSGTQLWTHYDVMDNILIHIVGRKKVVLFPPTESLNLYMNGDKSEIINIDNPDFACFPKFKNIQRYECVLEPGDILFIPALWLHNVKALDFVSQLMYSGNI